MSAWTAQAVTIVGAQGNGKAATTAVINTNGGRQSELKKSRRLIAELKCPECGCEMIPQGGCPLCPHCGYSKCG